MHNLSGLAGRIFNVPLAISRPKLDAILHVLGPRLGLAELPAVQAGLLDAARQDRKPYQVTADGIAVIDIEGTLVRKASGLDALSGMTSYQQIESEWLGAMEDGAVKGILACFDSPGGEVGGLFDLVDKLYSVRGTKPVYAVVNEQACSAAYAIASVCDQIFVTQTGAVGSIGVWALHVDQSEWDKKNGVKFTYSFAGDRKIDGNPHEPLSKEAAAEFQDEINRTYGLFVDTVARSRKISAKKVRGTEAGVFFGPEGVTEGLADKVGTAEDAATSLRSALGAPGKPGGRKGRNAMPAIAPHKTATTEAAWDGPAAKKNLREGESSSYYDQAYAFRDDEKDSGTKAAYDFIHHEVSADGEIGAANLEACESGIGILNGARGGTKLEGDDRKGVYRHLSRHMSDAGKEPPELKSEAQAAAIAAAEIFGVRAADASAPDLKKEAKVAEEKNKKKDDADARKGDDYMKDNKQPDPDQEDGGDDKDEAKREKKAGDKECSRSMAEITEIKDLCALAGVPDSMALDFIAKNTALPDVRKALVDERAKKSGQVITGLHGFEPGRTMAALESQAKDYAQTNRVTVERAMDRMLRANPKAYADYRREMIARQRAFELGIGGDFQMPGIMGASPTQYDVHVNVPLSNISVAFIQDEKSFVAADVFPNVPVLKQSDLYYTYTRADFNTSKFQSRAADGSGARAGYRTSATSSYLCLVQALGKDIPDQVRANMDAVLSADRDATMWLTQQFLIKRELDFVQNYMQTGIWTNNAAGGSTATGTLGAGGSTVMYWDNSASTPIEDVRNASRAMQLSSGGFRPVDLTLGRSVFDHLLDHPDIIDRVKYTGTEGSPAKGTKEILAELFEVQNVFVMDGVYNTAADGQTESNALIGGKNALLTYRPAAPSILTPSAGYTFSWTGLFGMGPMGTRLKTFREEPKAKDVVEMEAAYAQKVVSADCGFFFSNVTQS